LIWFLVHFMLLFLLVVLSIVLYYWLGVSYYHRSIISATRAPYIYVLKYLNLFGLVYGNSCTSLLPLTWAGRWSASVKCIQYKMDHICMYTPYIRCPSVCRQQDNHKLNKGINHYMRGTWRRDLLRRHYLWVRFILSTRDEKCIDLDIVAVVTMCLL
jgi:hypothetical protein